VHWLLLLYMSTILFARIFVKYVFHKNGGYCGGSPTAVRPSDPALCGSCPLVTPYYCRLGDLLCFMCVYRFVCALLSACVFVLFPLFDLSFVASFSTLILLVGSFDL